MFMPPLTSLAGPPRPLDCVRQAILHPVPSPSAAATCTDPLAASYSRCLLRPLEGATTADALLEQATGLYRPLRGLPAEARARQAWRAPAPCEVARRPSSVDVVATRELGACSASPSSVSPSPPSSRGADASLLVPDSSESAASDSAATRRPAKCSSSSHL